jgi:hypothetical protein
MGQGEIAVPQYAQMARDNAMRGCQESVWAFFEGYEIRSGSKTFSTTFPPTTLT